MTTDRPVQRSAGKVRRQPTLEDRSRVGPVGGPLRRRSVYTRGRHLDRRLRLARHRRRCQPTSSRNSSSVAATTLRETTKSLQETAVARSEKKANLSLSRALRGSDVGAPKNAAAEAEVFCANFWRDDGSQQIAVWRLLY